MELFLAPKDPLLGFREVFCSSEFLPEYLSVSILPSHHAPVLYHNIYQPQWLSNRMGCLWEGTGLHTSTAYLRRIKKCCMALLKRCSCHWPPHKIGTKCKSEIMRTKYQEAQKGTTAICFYSDFEESENSRSISSHFRLLLRFQRISKAS